MRFDKQKFLFNFDRDNEISIIIGNIPGFYLKKQ